MASNRGMPRRDPGENAGIDVQKAGSFLAGVLKLREHLQLKPPEHKYNTVERIFKSGVSKKKYFHHGFRQQFYQGLHQELHQ